MTNIDTQETDYLVYPCMAVKRLLFRLKICCLMSNEQNFSYSHGENKVTKHKLCRYGQYVQYLILIKFVGGGFFPAFLRFPPPIQLNFQ